jgi:hypothetical protein
MLLLFNISKVKLAWKTIKYEWLVLGDNAQAFVSVSVSKF